MCFFIVFGALRNSKEHVLSAALEYLSQQRCHPRRRKLLCTCAGTGCQGRNARSARASIPRTASSYFPLIVLTSLLFCCPFLDLVLSKYYFRAIAVLAALVGGPLLDLICVQVPSLSYFQCPGGTPAVILATRPSLSGF